MEYLGTSLNELPWFFAHMGTAIGLTLFYIIVYIWVTPHAEIALIRENNMAAALAIGGSLLGFCFCGQRPPSAVRRNLLDHQELRFSHLAENRVAF